MQGIRRELAALAAVWAGALALMIPLARRTGLTIDEPAHILSSILYWEGNDRLLPRDMPPLIKLAGGWAAYGARFRIVEEIDPVWEQKHEWPLAIDMIRRMNEWELRESLFRSRLPLFVFPLATAALLWWWGRQLWSPFAGIVAAALFLTEPTSLAHAVLYKNDHAAAFGYLLFWYRAWSYWRKPDWRNGAWLGLALAIACLAKMSMLVLLPIAGLILLLRRNAGGWMAIPVAYVWILAACQLEVRFLGPLPLPAPLWDGALSLLSNATGENAVYFLGARRPHGHPAYFVVAALVKAPEVLLALVAAGGWLIARRARLGQLSASDTFWLLPGLLYFALASRSPLQMGFRLILPSLPFAILVAAAACDAWRRTRLRWAMPVLAVATALPLLLYYPSYISYFNTASGGPKNGLRYLSDSNVDWGHSLRELRRYMRERRIPLMHVSYLGTDNPLAYLRREEMQWIEPPFSERGRQIRRYQPGPGLYAISANLISGQFFAEGYRDFYKAFREATPIDYAGYSIYIYRFP